MKHIMTKWITALSNFSVQYNFQVISVSLLVMSMEECTTTPEQCKNGNQAEWIHGTAAGTVFAGAILGQLVMGYAGDTIGRSPAMLLTLLIATLGAACSAIVPMGSPTSVYEIIIMFRFLLGVGLGGVYPLSAAKAAESSTAQISDSSSIMNSNRAALAYFYQVPGACTPWFLAYIFSFMTDLEPRSEWRLLLGLGAVPCAAVVVCSVIEMTHERAQRSGNSADVKGAGVGDSASAVYSPLAPTEKDTVDSDAVVAKSLPPTSTGASEDSTIPASTLRFKLFYAGGSWFLFDVVYYSVGLYGGQILNSIGPQRAPDQSVSSALSLRSTSLRQAVALSLGVPACVLTIALLKPLKTKRTQTLGFAFMTVCFVFIASIYDSCRRDRPSVLYAVYCLLLFSMAGGPNVTTFILPAETFPKEIRSTYNGMCAACGKLGAVVGVFGFGPLSRMTSFPFVMTLCACVSALGMALSHFCIGAENLVEGGRRGGGYRMSDGLVTPSPSCDLTSPTPAADLQRSIVTGGDCEEAAGDSDSDDEPVVI